MPPYTKKERIFQIISDFSIVTLSNIWIKYHLIKTFISNLFSKVSIAFLLVYLFLNPYDRGFYCNDESIRFPYLKDTIPEWLAGLYNSIGGLLVVILSELYINRQCCNERSDFKVNNTRWCLNVTNGSFLYLLGAACTMLISEIGKHSIGRLRPHFIAVCKPDWNLISCFEKIDDVLIPNYIHFNRTICTGDPKLIKEARLSFPSAHSSFTVYSMVFVIIYMEARMGHPRRCNFVKSCVQLTAFIIAWFTCMSRVSDFKHHHTDVIAGSVIGLSVAVFVTFVTGKQIFQFQRIKFEKHIEAGIEDDSEQIKIEDLRAI